MLPGAVSLVLLLVALTSVTYLGKTLFPALVALDVDLRSPPRALPSPRLARSLGMAVTMLALLAAAFGLRVGGMGHGGELVPSLALAVAAAAALGAGTALGSLSAGKVARSLASARVARLEAKDETRVQRTIEGVMARLAFAAADDLHAERDEADAALTRLGEALHALEGTGAEVEAKLGALGDEDAAGDLGRDLRRTREEVRAKVELGRRVHATAAAAAFRLACSVPVRKLLRQRPRDVTGGLEGALDAQEATEMLHGAFREIEEFLGAAAKARDELAEVTERRPREASEQGEASEDPWAEAVRDVDAIEGAYRALAHRVSVVTMRLSARERMAAVARAAGEVSDKARASGIPADELTALLHEMARAEAAVQVASPPELDGRALSEALARGTTALGEGGDGAKLDELLRALREVG